MHSEQSFTCSHPHTCTPLFPHILIPSHPHSDPEVLPLMRDSVDKLLLLLDIRQDPAPIWPALHALASAVARWSLVEDKVSR